MRRLVLGSMVLLGAVVPCPAEAVRTLPPEVYGQLKGGRKLDKVWASPKFDRSKGFVVGTINSDIADSYQGPYATTIPYFSTPLNRIAMADSPYTLNLTVNEFQVRDGQAMGIFNVVMGVEGQITDADGQLMMAFQHRDTVNNRENATVTCMGLMDKITYTLRKELGPGFEKNLQAKAVQAASLPVAGTAPAAPAPKPAAPLAPSQPADAKGRLLQLQDLLANGLITQEEFDAKKAEILKGL